MVGGGAGAAGGSTSAITKKFREVSGAAEPFSLLPHGMQASSRLPAAPAHRGADGVVLAVVVVVVTSMDGDVSGLTGHQEHASHLCGLLHTGREAIDAGKRQSR